MLPNRTLDPVMNLLYSYMVFVSDFLKLSTAAYLKGLDSSFQSVSSSHMHIEDGLDECPHRLSF